MLEVAEPLNVALAVRDLESSRRFYAQVLGLPLWREEPRIALHFGAGGALLSFYAAADGERGPRGVRLLLAVASGIDTVCEELGRRGVRFEAPLEDRPIGRSAMFRDPDGHELWVCQPSATETQFYRWRLAERSRTRRVPVQRPANPRRHRPEPRARRERHPEA